MCVRAGATEADANGPALIVQRSLPEEAAALVSGQLDPTVYLDRTLRRLDDTDRQIRAFLPEPDRQRRIDQRLVELSAQTFDQTQRPPLYGVAVGIKDCIRVDGLETRAGSRLPLDTFAGSEASIVTRLGEAGAVILGKTAMDEFAYAEPSPTRNPHRLTHTPGGSSSGSAATVAAGLCSLAVGTQTSRSVIGPAAFCGVVGFKPTFGRLACDGVIPLAPSFDTVGFFTQDVQGMLLAAATLIPGWQIPGWQSAGDAQLPVLGIPEGRFLSWTLATGRAAFEEHVARLQAAGYDVRPMPFLSDDAVMQMDQCAMTLLHGEMARVHAAWFPRYAALYRPRTARAIIRGQSISDDEIDACRAHQATFRSDVAARMDQAEIDLWITPASAGPAPAGYDVTGWGGMTTAWSYAGMPCVTVPAATDPNGLPLGLQAVARVQDDERLLVWARGLETALADTACR